MKRSNTSEMIGRSFGRWTVIGKASKTHWTCRCACGTVKNVIGTSLRRGTSVSCRKCKPFQDLTDMRFGKLTVIKRMPNNENNQIVWLCRCDCGIEKEIIGSCLKAGKIKTCRKCRHGEFNSRWKGGRVEYHGYTYVYAPDHPNASKSGGHVAEHVLVMSRVLGRQLMPGETVHHKNGIRNDNRPENLELWTKSHPSGQRVEDVLEWAEMMLRIYRPERLALT